MNRKVLWSVIVLLWVFLILFVLMKLLFGSQFLAVVTNEKILLIGNFIDSHLAVRILCDTLIGLLSMQFYLCSCKQVWRLRWYEYSILSLYTLALAIGYIWNPSWLFIVDLCGFISIPLLMKANLKQVLSVFVLHQLGQILVLTIRSEHMYLASANYATRFVLVFDVQIWLILYYLYSNLYKEKTLWECLGSPFSAIKRPKNSKKNS